MTIPENPSSFNTQPVMPVYRRDSSLAIASMICGLAAWVFVPFFGALAAIITGHLAKKEIRESNGFLTGDGMAKAGLILGYVQIGAIALAITCILAFAFSLFGIHTSSLTGPSASIILNLI
jgi:hypothetical protein